jgi:transglutaminase-like putative cysteine protease
VPRTLALGVVAATLISWNWLRLENGTDDGQALLIIVLALAPAALPGLRARIAAAVVAFLIAAGSAFDLVPGIHYPGRLLARFGQGYLDFYDIKLPFDPGAQPRMHGVILIATFAFTLATSLAIAARRPRWAALALLVGAGWPATVLAGHDFQRGAALLAGLLVLLVGLRERPRALGYAPAAGLAVVLVALAASSTPALARQGFVDWQSWDFYTRPAKPVSVSYVWDSDYSGLKFPRKQTVVLKIKAPSRPQYWRAVTLNDVVGGRWLEDAAAQEQSSGYLGEPGLVPRGARERSNWVQQQVTVEALRDTHLVVASVPVRVDASKLGLVQYDPSGMVFVARGLRRGDSYTAWSYEPDPSPEQLARSRPDYPQLIAPPQYNYLAVDQRVFVAPFGTPGRREAIDWLFTNSFRAPEIDPYRPLYDKAEEIAGGAKSPYAAAVALESWFRNSPAFLYDPHPPRPPGNVPPLVDFVTRTHSGYCQHFAGAMALMLRYLGVPARVAAGFSSGQFDRTNEQWVVTDHDAHEWVEAWFDGWGWVPFDPTPGRGGLAGAYSASSRTFDATAAAQVLAGKEGLKAFARRRVDLGFAKEPIRLGPDTPDLTLPRVAATAERHSRTPGLLRLLALVAAGLVVAIALAKLLVRSSRYLTRDPRRLAAACRKELRDVLLDQLVDVPPSATLTELAALAEAELGVSAAAFGLHGTAARFAPPGYAREAAREMRRALRQIRRDLRSELSRFERTRGLLSLRSLGLA